MEINNYNQFHLLSTEEADHPQVEGKWNQIKDEYCYTAKNTLGVLLHRKDGTIDVKLRQEQAGFRRVKGCTDQIFAVCNIIEQSIEWNAPLCIGFIDFKKAFDNIHHSTIW